MTTALMLEAPKRHCFAEPGANSIIDEAKPDGRGYYSGESLEEIRLRYPRAEIIPLEEFCAAKAARQDEPITWQYATKEQFHEMLNVLPPAIMLAGGFLVGEPLDHHALTGRPRFEGYRERGGRFWVSSRAITIQEFKHEMGAR